MRQHSIQDGEHLDTCWCHYEQAPHPAQMALEHDRTQVAEHVTAMKNTLQNYAWLLDGRGSYEWDDDRYRLEFQTVCTAMQKHIEVLARIAADWSNCPEKWEDVQKARQAESQPAASDHAAVKEEHEKLYVAILAAFHCCASGDAKQLIANFERDARLKEAESARRAIMRCEQDWTWRVFKESYLDDRIAQLKRGEV